MDEKHTQKYWIHELYKKMETDIKAFKARLYILNTEYPNKKRTIAQVQARMRALQHVHSRLTGKSFTN